ncbi:S-adenosyl-L-methionine-dependent methyltransferase [Xylariomycetidae sp. FL0641]|nr:S-adenosyl-L-methionine-dependent methyltransferase [Xylariomycetidae sp. FL0641]
MAAPGAFVPKQAMPYDSKLFELIGADETLGIAQHLMTLLPLPFPADTVLHDAACGLGPVTQSVLATGPPASIRIHATDLAPAMVGLYNQAAAAGGWPCRAAVLDAQAQAPRFADAALTHAILAFGLPILADPAAGARELRRTLRPGGTAATAFWLRIPQGECAQAARRAVWGAGARLAVEPHPRHRDRAFHRDLLLRAGFEDVRLYEKSAFLPVGDLDEFAKAIWTAIGQPPGGWTRDDEDRWDEAVDTYKDLLRKEEGFHVAEDGSITLEAVAQIAIAKKPVTVLEKGLCS